MIRIEEVIMEQLTLFDLNEEERKYVLISLKPEYYQWMLDGYKKYEYRSRFPDSKTFTFIYVTKPVGAIKACSDFERPIRENYALVGKSGQGVEDFIAGRKGNKMAIPINRIYQLKREIPLSEMKDYDLTAPQSYCYIKKGSPCYELLRKQVEGYID